MIDRNNHEIGKILLHKYQLQIKIVGKLHQNRALNGDIVAFQILPQTEWIQTKIELNDDVEDAEETRDSSAPVSSLQQEMNLKGLLELATKLNLTPIGRVVGIVKRNERDFCGHITKENTDQINH